MDTDPYMESIERYRDVLKNALEIADDPYKPPELTVATSKDVLTAAWDMQIEYAIVTRANKV
jgi:hypothetical protein